ncbi:MAG: FtsQ-type POTRA domain-containing protein [Dehalococcoidia bacterium]
MPAPRRYEVPRSEPRRTDLRRADYRRPRGHSQGRVSWRRIGALALATTGVTAVLFGATWLYRSDVLRVRVIDVEGVQVGDPQTIANVSGLAGVSMLTLDLGRASGEIGKLPAVKAATVSREWPHGIRIDVTEHQAWGYWQAGPQRLVIDEEGRVLEQSRPPTADAPTIVEVASQAADVKSVAIDADTVRLVNRLRTDGTFERLNVKPTSYVFRRDRGLTVIVASGPAAVLGDSSNYEFKVRTWQVLMEQVRAGQVPQVATAPRQPDTAAPAMAQPAMASEIDLRFGRNVVLR